MGRYHFKLSSNPSDNTGLDIKQKEVEVLSKTEAKTCFQVSNSKDFQEWMDWWELIRRPNRQFYKYSLVMTKEILFLIYITRYEF